MFLSIFRFLCGISFLKLHLFIIYFVYVVEDKKWHGSRDKVRGQRSVSSLLPPSVSGDQARVARLSDTHLYLACMAVCHAYKKAREGIGYSETGRDGSESPCRFWDSNPVPLVKQLVSSAHRPLCTCIFFFEASVTFEQRHEYHLSY